MILAPLPVLDIVGLSMSMHSSRSPLILFADVVSAGLELPNVDPTHPPKSMHRSSVADVRSIVCRPTCSLSFGRTPYRASAPVVETGHPHARGICIGRVPVRTRLLSSHSHAALQPLRRRPLCRLLVRPRPCALTLDTLALSSSVADFPPAPLSFSPEFVLSGSHSLRHAGSPRVGSLRSPTHRSPRVTKFVSVVRRGLVHACAWRSWGRICDAIPFRVSPAQFPFALVHIV